MLCILFLTEESSKNILYSIQDHIVVDYWSYQNIIELYKLVRLGMAKIVNPSFEKNAEEIASKIADYHGRMLARTISSVNTPSTVLGGSPHWCSLTESLIYIDTLGKKIFQLLPKTRTCECMVMEQCVGFAIPTSDSSPGNLFLFVGLEDRIVEVSVKDKKILRILVAIPEGTITPGRFSDAKCSQDGILHAGNKGRAPIAPYLQYDHNFLHTALQ